MGIVSSIPVSWRWPASGRSAEDEPDLQRIAARGRRALVLLASQPATEFGLFSYYVHASLGTAQLCSYDVINDKHFITDRLTVSLSR